MHGGGGGAHRRRKKRSNYGIRTVEVNRGTNGFGFTISGQQPCILSCIVAGSPADLAGLRAGDFLISVNGMNVSKLPHESVVQLIGGTHGTIRMAIAENYYSDSSDEDIMFHGAQQQQHRARPKYPHKAKFSRSTAAGVSGGVAASSAAGGHAGSGQPERHALTGGSTPIKGLTSSSHSVGGQVESAEELNDSHSTTAYNVIHSPNASNSCDISNVSAMVRSVQLGDPSAVAGGTVAEPAENALEYQAVVGYLGTIEMPKQIATSSKLQTVRSCIRKMRQEKRNPTTVLMTILPSCLNLTNTSNHLIANYASARLSYVSSSSESDNKYFGLVTSAIYADGLMCESADVLSHRKDVVISNSCHVFVIDGKLVEHELHLEKATLFRIVCTKDPITNLCLEFPSNSEYVVNLIRSMYSLKSLMKVADAGTGSGYAGRPPVARSLNLEANGNGRYPRNRSADPRLNARGMDDPHDVLAASSPQPSNHSEITTTSSNSDSGIGFHNDCRNISDRILLVDFPGMLGPQQQRLLQQQQIANVRAHYRKSHPFLRPAGIINEIPPKLDPIRNIRSTTGATAASPESGHSFRLQIVHGKSKSADYSFPSTSGAGFVDRLTVRARPDPKTFASERSPSKENALNGLHAERAPSDGDGPGSDPWTVGHTVDEQGNVVEERAIDVPPMVELFLDLERYNNDNVKNSLLATARSCDDMILSLGKGSSCSLADEEDDGGGEALADVLLDAEAYERLKVKLSIDDLTLVSSGSTERLPSDSTATMMMMRASASAIPNGCHNGVPNQHAAGNQHVFLQPLKPVKRSKKACTTHTTKVAAGRMAAVHGGTYATDENSSSNRSSVHGGVVGRVGDKLAAYKLSPKVFGLPRPISVSFENISTLSADAGAHRVGGSTLGDSVCGGPADGPGASGRKRSQKTCVPGTPGSGRASRSGKRLSGGFSAIWGSLQELRTGSFASKHEDRSRHEEQADGGGGTVTPKQKKERERRLSGCKILEATYSEPDLRCDEVSAPNLLEGIQDDDGTDEGKQINHNASPFRRWGQSSLRSRSTEHRTPILSARRPSSLAASESDVYTKSIDDDYSSTKSGYNPYGDAASTGALAPEVTVTGPGSASGIVATVGGPTGVASWGTSFEKLLEDAGGLHTFSEFLKKEFSAENIYFWTACERYRQLAERDERAREAQAIFAKHLESGCSEPVNVDSIARNIALENLPQAEPTLFAAAQKQIFNLMKFDSYQRFIKSDMYRVCQEAEAKGQVLPYPGEQLDPLLRTSSLMAPSGSGAMTKLKKSLSNAEDRRRKSLLPWHRKTRCKSKDRGDSDASKKDSGKGATSAGGNGASGGGGGGSSSNTLKLLSTNSTSDIHSSRSSLASFDAAIGGKSYDPDDSRNTLCRVILSNGATTVVQTRSNETIKELVERLLEKRGIVYNAYEAFLAGSTKPLDLDGPSVSLAGKEVNIDQRVVFKLNLPNRKMISVKSKATKPLGDVLRPILYKYSYELDQMRVYSTDVYLELTHPVTTVDGLCLYIRAASDATSTAGGSIVHPELGRTLAGARPVINTATHQQIVHHFQQQQHQQQQQQQQQQQLLNGPPSTSVPQQHNFVVPSSVLPGSGTSNVVGAKNVSAFANGLAIASALCNNNNLLSVNQNHVRAKEQQEALKDEQSGGRPQELNTLDEITNKVFNELMNGKTGNNAVAGGKGGGPPDVDCASDTSSSRRDRFRRRGSNAPSESGRGAKSKKCSTGGSEDGGESVNNLGLKKPIIAKLKAGVKLQMPTRSQNDELLEGLKRAQRSRLEDQRGTEINFELPDFLKDKENLSVSVAPVAGGSNGSAAPAPSKLTRSKPARRSESGTPTAEFGGSLQQINKPQPAPRLSITGQQQQQQHHRGSGYGSPVQTAVSDSHLNLSTQCNASPNPLDDPFHAPVGGSQSENSYADTTLVFTHATSGQSPTAPTIRALHALSDDQSDASGDGNAGTTRATLIAANGCCDHPEDTSPGSSPPSHSTHLHPHHYHHAGASATGASGSVNSTVASATAYHTHYPLLHHHHHHHPHGQHYHHHPGRYQATVLPNGVGPTDSHPGSNVDGQRGPPPLPPKPKILPIKPSNWGHPSAGVAASSGAGSTAAYSDAHSPSGLSSSPSSSNHSPPSSNGGGGGMVGTGATNGILSTNNTDILGSTTREPGRRVANGGTEERIGGTTGGPTVISSVVAQARSIYFDQGNSSFV